MNIIKNCKECELSSDSCSCVCLSSDVCTYCSGSGVYENDFGNLFDCSACEGTGRYHGFIDLAAAPSPSVPAVESWPSVPHSLSDVELKTYLKSATADGIYRRQVKTKSGRAVAYYLVFINGFYVSRINPVRIYEYELTSSQSSARKFRTPLQLKYLGKLTDFLDSINRSYEIQVWRDCSTLLSTEEQSK